MTFGASNVRSLLLSSPGAHFLPRGAFADRQTTPLVTDAPPLPPLDQIRLLHGQVDARLGRQQREWEGIDRKATTVLAATGVVLGLVVNNGVTFAAGIGYGPGLFVAALLALASCLAVGLLAITPRLIDDVPEPGPLLTLYAAQSEAYTLGVLAKSKATALVTNRPKLRWKVRLLKVQIGLLAVAGCLLVLVIFVEEVWK